MYKIKIVEDVDISAMIAVLQSQLVFTIFASFPSVYTHFHIICALNTIEWFYLQWFKYTISLFINAGLKLERSWLTN